MKELAIGAAAGCAATGPMTWAMELMHRKLMITAHLVWGSALGFFIEMLEHAPEVGGLPSMGSSPQTTGGGNGGHH